MVIFKERDGKPQNKGSVLKKEEGRRKKRDSEYVKEIENTWLDVQEEEDYGAKDGSYPSRWPLFPERHTGGTVWRKVIQSG